MHKINRTITEQIFEILRNRIINCEIEPGSRLTIMNLSHEFGVSQTPIKDVLKQLSERGLVVTDVRKGYYVIKLTTKDIKEIMQLRKLLEECALATSQFSLSQVKQLKKEMEMMSRNNAEQRKINEFYELDQRLHSFIVQSSSNKRLQKLFFEIYDLVSLCFRIGGNIDTFTEQHIKILDAILRGDSQEALRILHDHLTLSEQEIIQASDRPKLEKNKRKLCNIGSENPSAKSKLEIEDRPQTKDWGRYANKCVNS